MNQAIETLKLNRTFKIKKAKDKPAPSFITALEEVNLTINKGELFGLLGPNGAGKTTLIKILCTLLLPTSGTALVDGVDVVKNPALVRRRINMVSGGEHSGYGILNVRENLWMFSQFYGVPSKLALERIGFMLKKFGLWDRVAIIDRGQVLECGTPAALKRKLQQDAIYQLDVDLLTDHLEKFSEIPEVVNFAFEHKPGEAKTVLKIILKDEAGGSKGTKPVESSRA